MRSRLPVLDGVAALVMVAFLVGVTPVSRVTQPDVRPLSAVGYALLVVAGLSVAGRRVLPQVSYAVAVAATTAYLALRFPGWPIYLPAVAGLAALVTAAPRSRWVPEAAAGGVAVAVATGPPEGWQAARMVVVAVGWGVIAAFAGRAAEDRRRRADQQARAQVAEERLRIARELHDVLSHSLAAISMQAGVGLHLLGERPQQAEEALAAIRRLSTDALAQARAALAVTRAPEEVAPATVTTAGVGELQRLVASVRAAGTPVELAAGLDDVAVPEPVGVAVYRVVQESLTNVMRHAGSCARARVGVGWRDGHVEVEVTDDGAGASAGSGPPGHGLTGMRERVGALGGHLEAGPVPDGGWRVRASIPWKGRS